MSVEAVMPPSSGAQELRIEPRSPVLARPGATGEGYRSTLAEVGTMHSRASNHRPHLGPRMPACPMPTICTGRPTSPHLPSLDQRAVKGVVGAGLCATSLPPLHPRRCLALQTPCTACCLGTELPQWGAAPVRGAQRVGKALT